jgi:hypothetical protein
LIAKIKSDELEYRRLSSLFSKCEVYSSNIQAMEQQLSSLPVIDETYLDQQKRMYHLYQEYKIKKDKLDHLEKQLGDPERDVEVYDQSLAGQIAYENKLYAQEKSKADKLGLPYDEAAIKDKISRIELTILHQSDFINNEMMDKLIADILRLNSRIDTDATDHTVTQLQCKFRELEQSRSILSCPHCESSVRMIDGKLCKAEGTSFDQHKYDECKRSLEHHKEQLALIKRSQHLHQQLKAMTRAIIPDGVKKVDVRTLRSHLQELSSIKVVAKPTLTAEHVNHCIQWHMLKQQYLTIKNQIDQMEVPAHVSLEQLNRDSQILSTRKSLLSSLNNNKQMMNNCQVSKECLSQVQEQIESSQQRLSTMNRHIHRTSLVEVAHTKKATVEELQLQVKGLSDRSYIINALKEMAVKLECESLDAVLSSINDFMAGAVDDLFFHPITVQLSLYKHVKSTCSDKVQVNLSIMYKGAEMTDVNSLSGGEKERINLMLTVAMHRVCGGQLLILDESLVSLDSDNKDVCNAFIKKSLPDSIVLVVCHEACEGFYDKVIHFNE